MPPALEASGVTKRFGAVVALNDARLTVGRGEVHALLGANGCGKSTLCKIIAGTVARDDGEIRVAGEARALASPRAAEAAGIALYYQELSLVPQLTVAENVFLGHEPRGFGGFVDETTLNDRTDLLIGRFAGVAGEGFTARTRVSDLSPDQRQITEILKVLARKPRLIIFDEATAALDRRQVDVFFSIMKDLRAEGISSIFISHRLDEVFRVADRITVMRNGATVADFATAETTPEAIVREMVGDVRLGPKGGTAAPAEAAEIRLSVEGVTGGRLQGVSFAARRGEILGLGGLQGQGQKRLLAGLFGADPFTGGRVLLDGEPVAPRRPADAIAAGFGLVSGDRARDAAFPGRSILENAAMASLVRDKARLILLGPLRSRFSRTLSGLKTRYAGLNAPIGSLSGGNQQKIFIARWLAARPSVLLLDDPTKGIDLGAKADFFAIVRALAGTGATILIYSSEDADLLSLCHRVLVFNGGRITADLTGSTLDAMALTRAAYGEAA
ncbi:sugar ABC transporter ATP-binding protein [Chthonobacter rhizosphaerae]|uniref:sugar ABC transporter ATP-binding protein n=1 Tax=Chthonobacter rhizosphaerae TaxID=2735553 RepID=UPI0015EE8670|nr:sugar ABC transporter ATP-binding protein [Chthonobacter rhizosphaerae]